jgi:hypothetical protein
MKKIFFLFWISGILYGYSQTSMNMSFEEWKTVTPPFGTTYEDIDGWWATVNDVKRITGDNNHLTAFKYTPAQEGSYAIRLKSTQALTTFIPGVVVTGSFSFQQQQLLQGKPYTGKPIKLKGFYRFIPINGDSGVAYIHLSRWNTLTNQRDTLARDSVLFIQTQTEWKSFELNLDYSQFPGIQPDSIVIRFVSSVNAGFGGGKVGTELMIDNLSLEYPVYKENPYLTDFQVYPNPFVDKFYIRSFYQKNLKIDFYNSLGEHIRSDELLRNEQIFEMTSLPSGSYFIIIKNFQNEIVGTQKIFKE